jgi:hypothetical protein
VFVIIFITSSQRSSPGANTYAHTHDVLAGEDEDEARGGGRRGRGTRYHAEVGRSHPRDAGVAAHLLEEAEEEVDHGPVELGHPRRDHLQAIGRIVGHQHAIVTGNVTNVR